MRLLLVTLFLCTCFNVAAFQVKPMVAELESLGSQSQRTMRILNTSKEPLTVEISANNLTLDAAGNELLSENEDDFLILPMTTVIPVGKSQSVLIRYIGEPMLTESKSYRIIVDQVAVDLAQMNTSGVGMTLSFQTLFNVVPKDAQAKIEIMGKTMVSKGVWEIELENKGNRYVRLAQEKWLIQQDSDVYTLEGRELSDALVGKFLMPNSKLKVKLKVPEKFDISRSQLEIKLDATTN
ncbi:MULTISPECIES: fimbrial biogenesis chaperone [Pseudoalteromonas]|uniref:molecular chaperone n=1 Tax=Pseudoalteromonas TaxID=53246 RepID=UPI0007E4F936|nr:molecular chaperone [Pseudoalteromonas prydzensis]MBE0379393.1 hypothetical protein [Pseudoalteromonas prydzensis ACAM 620]